MLQPTVEGTLMCSVDSADVRPFWGRVIASSVMSAALIYAAMVLAVFGFMRQVGYPVTVEMIGWPPNWSEINQAKSRYFLQNAQNAYEKGELSETVMSLSLAYEYDIYNYDAGFFLAKLWQASRPEVSNHLYQELIANHPDFRTQTAEAWLRSLLPRADYAWIEKLAPNALRFGDNNTPAWLNALLFSNQRTQDDSVIQSLLETPDSLAPGVETVLRWEQTVRDLAPEEARTNLLQPPPAYSPEFVYYFQIRRLISLGFPVDAIDLLGSSNNPLNDRDRITLELRALSKAGFRRSYQNLFNRILRLSPSLAQLDILTSHLASNPDPELYRRAKVALHPQSLTTSNQRLPASLAIFCVAGVHGDIEYQNKLAMQIRELTQSKFVVLDAAIAAMALPDLERAAIRNLLPSLQPLSLDITYALLEHFDPVEAQ
ncbi:MAG: hypothetical protein HOH58_07200 [Opitutaceae bacterium]|nr:hypothetical protein [Opitutaceae bacterium]